MFGTVRFPLSALSAGRYQFPLSSLTFSFTPAPRVSDDRGKSSHLSEHPSATSLFGVHPPRFPSLWGGPSGCLVSIGHALPPSKFLHSLGRSGGVSLCLAPSQVHVWKLRASPEPLVAAHLFLSMGPERSTVAPTTTLGPPLYAKPQLGGRPQPWALIVAFASGLGSLLCFQEC